MPALFNDSGCCVVRAIVVLIIGYGNLRFRL